MLLLFLASSIDPPNFAALGGQDCDTTKGFRHGQHLVQQPKLIHNVHDYWMQRDGCAQWTQTGGLLQDVIVDTGLLKHDAHDQPSQTSTDNDDTKIRRWWHIDV